jgi:hypothetical protein
VKSPYTLSMTVPGGAISEMMLKRGVRATSKIMFTVLVILLHCEIAAVVVSSAATSMLPNLSSFGNNIAKAYRNNHTDEVPIHQRKVGELARASTVESDSKVNVDQINRQPSILLDESKRRIWCFGPHADSKVKNQRYYLPVRFLSVLRKKDVIILPGNHAPTREFVDFMIPLLGLSEDQIIWTSGESISIDADIDTNIRNRIKDLIETSGTTATVDSEWVLVPYCVTKSFLGWSSELCTKFSVASDSGSDSSGLPISSETSAVGTQQTVNPDLEGGGGGGGGGATLEIFGESESWNAKYGHKGILHRHMADLSISSVMDDIDHGSVPTLVAKGYQCSTVDHLLKAYELLKTQTLDNRAVIKPISGCAGWGILFIDSAEELMKYDFPMGEVLLEEMLNLDMTEDGLVISPAVHYLGPQLFGGQLVDQLMKNTSYLGWRESKADPTFQQKVLDMTEKLLKFTQPRVSS